MLKVFDGRIIARQRSSGTCRVRVKSKSLNDVDWSSHGTRDGIFGILS